MKTRARKRFERTMRQALRRHRLEIARRIARADARLVTRVAKLFRRRGYRAKDARKIAPDAIRVAEEKRAAQLSKVKVQEPAGDTRG